MEVYHPEISPNGQRVAFCTSAEGKSGHSSIYVRDLDDFNHNLVKLDVPGGAAIPRWRVKPNGDTVIVYVTSPYNNDGDQFLQESTWKVPFADRHLERQRSCLTARIMEAFQMTIDWLFRDRLDSVHVKRLLMKPLL